MLSWRSPPSLLFLALFTVGCGTSGACLSKVEFDDPTPTRYTCQTVETSDAADRCEEYGSKRVAGDTQFTEEWVEDQTCPELGYSTDCGANTFYAGPTCRITSPEDGAQGWNTPGNRVAGGSTSSPAGTTGGTSCDSYQGPTADIQRDSQCQAAWSAKCAGQDSKPYCELYNSSSWGAPGSCPYC